MVKIKVDGLSKTYTSERVLKNLFFEFSGGIIGIAGPNGSGKSTLMRCISGLTKPTAGSVQWIINGEEFSNKTISHTLGYAAPYVQLYDELSASENLQFIHDLRSSQNPAQISVLIQTFDLSDFSDSLFGELSSGQQQRVKLAAAAIHKPKILCLDEPGTNLDEAGHSIVKMMTNACIKNEGMVFLASNQTQELNLCDHVVDLAP